MDDLRQWLEEKERAGVKQVRVTTMLAKLKEAEELAAASERNGTVPAQMARRVVRDLRQHTVMTWWEDKDGPHPILHVGDLVGTAEIGKMLGVERPRIGRYRKAGVLPAPVAELAATPVWLRREIEAVSTLVEARRRAERSPAK